MSLPPVSSARVSNLLQMDLSTQQIDSAEQQLQDTQQQLSTGHRINLPSDDPGGAAVVMQLQRTMTQQSTYLSNLQAANNQLSDTDSTLSNLNDLMTQAQTIASQNVGSEVSASERQAAAQIVESLYSRAVSIGNTQYNGSYLFGGDKAKDPPFVVASGGVQFVGSSTLLRNNADPSTLSPLQVNGADVFGALSTRVTGSVDLTPSLTSATRISDLRGANGKGVQLGSVQISNGTTTKTVDLSNADTIQDVVNSINAAGVGSVAASISGNHLVLSGGATENISVCEIGGGSSAASLGILNTAGAGAGVSLVGAGVQPNVTPLTPISALKDGAGIDTTHGLIITNGGTTATVNFTGATTVQDLLNAINSSGTNVQASIDPSGTGIDIVNPVQGTQMTIAENGGTTAADLGVRSFSLSTPLSELNNGKGVQISTSGPDFQITRSDGTTFQVSLTGATTVQDVINKINAADAGGGVTASFATTGNGIVLTDTAGGAGTLTMTPENFSSAASDLGLTNPASGNVITGTDVDPIQANGIFTDLAKLRDALNNNDQAGITAAAQALQADQDRVTGVRAQNGAQLQELQSRQDSINTQNVATQALISQLRDTDFAATISQFNLMQTSLQATLQAAAKTMNMSLMNFLT